MRNEDTNMKYFEWALLYDGLLCLILHTHTHTPLFLWKYLCSHNANIKAKYPRAFVICAAIYLYIQETDGFSYCDHKEGICKDICIPHTHLHIYPYVSQISNMLFHICEVRYGFDITFGKSKPIAVYSIYRCAVKLFLITSHLWCQQETSQKSIKCGQQIEILKI